ncbi:hypothetical protein [Paracoccus siganidrum]|uniref:hypothetical protein n=1 Tax=Paracoccus siganidrum TaxID=1276757 RepID=UPI0011C3C054|nr:hypothetical protein [Paracoccus siganidrum]
MAEDLAIDLHLDHASQPQHGFTHKLFNRAAAPPLPTDFPRETDRQPEMTASWREGHGQASASQAAHASRPAGTASMPPRRKCRSMAASLISQAIRHLSS